MSKICSNENSGHTARFGSIIPLTKAQESAVHGRTVSVRPSLLKNVQQELARRKES